MGTSTLELTLISAKDLKEVNLISKMEVYAVVCLSGDPRSQQRIATDRTGGRNPTWNATVRLTIPASGNDTLRVILRSERALGDRDVGEVYIPLAEILAGVSDELTQAKFVSYQVRKTFSGKPQGVLNLSYKVGPATKPPSYVPAAYPQPPQAVYPPTGKPGGPYPPPESYPPPAAYPNPGKMAEPYPPPAAYPPTAKPMKTNEPVTAYPVAGPSTATPYTAPPQQYGYPPQPAAGNGYPPPPPQAGYGYPQQPAAGYGYAQQPVRPPKKNNKFGMGLGAGLLGGALGGMVLGGLASDSSSYDAGYDGGFDDGGGFDF